MERGLESELRLLGKATRQLGLFTLADAVAADLSTDVLYRRLRTGRWEVVLRGVYRVAGQPVVWEQLLLAAVLFNGPEAVASHRAAARLWGLPGFASAPVEVTKRRGRNQRREYGWVHGSLHLPREHRTAWLGIPVTIPARTIFDLAGTQHPKRVERTLDSALNRRLCTYGSLEVVFAALAKQGRRGTVVMRELLEARGTGYVAPSSELESLGRQVLREAGLPSPVAERDLGDDDGWIGRVDLVYRDARLVIELDSRYHHALLDRTSDRRRDDRLHVSGWRVLRYTWWDLVERPLEVVGEIRRALALASVA